GRSSLDSKRDVVGFFVVGLLFVALLQSAVVVAVWSDAVKHVALFRAVIFQFRTREWVFRHFLKILRRKFLEVFRESGCLVPETLHGKRGKGESLVCDALILAQRGT